MGMYNFFSPWTSTTSASQPLTLDAYITFFLVPFIVASLIGQDKNTDMEGGWEMMQLEGDQGEDENSMLDDDPVLDAVFAANAKRRNSNLAAVSDKKRVARGVKADKENTEPAVSPSLYLIMHGISLMYVNLGHKGEESIYPKHVQETDNARFPFCKYSCYFLKIFSWLMVHHSPPQPTRTGKSPNLISIQRRSEILKRISLILLYKTWNASSITMRPRGLCQTIY
jgi:hypothetical protein